VSLPPAKSGNNATTPLEWLRLHPLLFLGVFSLLLLAIALLWYHSSLIALVQDAPARRAVENRTLSFASLLVVLATAAALLARRQQRQEDERQALTSRYQAIFQQAQDSVIVADSASGQVVDANPAALEQLGYELGELRALPLKSVLRGPRGDADTVAMLLQHIVPGRGHELQQVGKDGRVLEVDVSSVPVLSHGRYLVSFLMRDLSERKRAQTLLLANHERLDKLAHHDHLTGLPNRTYLQAHLPAAIGRAKAAGQMLAVLFLDLDRFKHINDSRGHEVGDKLLQEIAKRVRAAVRPTDVVVRMGGDEFIVVLDHVTGIDQVQTTATRVNEVLGAPVVIDGRALVATVSIGVSMFPRDGESMGELLKHSDTAMYHAKDSGRNNFQVFNPQLDQTLKRRVAIEASLRAAIKLNQLDVHYQPIIDIHTQRVCGLEALLRWQHPSQGWLSPDQFIGVAEETGLILPIGHFVIHRAAQDLAKWREQGANLVPVSVNISAVQLERSDLRDIIQRALTQYRIEPAMLQLELTEGSLFEKRTGEFREDAIAKLRELGVKIAIDDFGTGYSSLSYLKRWRVDWIKIDRSFVRDIVTDLSDHAIVSAIIAMARSLNIQVVAEGIEGWQQLEILRSMGCQKAQGFLFARPAPASETLRFMQTETFDMLDSGSFRLWGQDPQLAETGS
jgi:diguanylate cyclase (GGDEF)-like protein/PAS domain S-box-containing protein